MSEIMDGILGECVSSLGPYLDQLVIAGGWVPYIYSKMSDPRPAQDPLLTRDFDTVIPAQGFTETENELTLDQVILDAGFTHDFASLDNPPVVKYSKTMADKSVIEIEFITDKDVGDQDKVKKIGSVNAQALSNVDLLMDNPWEFSLCEHGLADKGMLRISRPAPYILHKTLVAPRRRHEEKTAKDLYYIFYVLEAFPSWRDETLNQIGVLAASKRAWGDQARQYLMEMFEGIDSKGVDYLVQQRPSEAFPAMNEDQFKQYVLFIMSELIEALG